MLHATPVHRAPPSARWPAGDESGFVMVMVVLLLFAVAVAGATGYQLASAEVELAAGSEDGQKALSAARAGLDRFVGENLGVPHDTAAYVVGDADVYVIPHRLVHNEDPEDPDLFLIESIGEVADPRYPDSPARRTVRQYARLHKHPVSVPGVVTTVATNVTMGGGAAITGDDQAGNNQRGDEVDEVGRCTGNDDGRGDVYGIVARTTGGGGSGVVYGEPAARLALGSVAAVLDSVDVRWSVLQDPNFPVKYTLSSPPPYASYPDSFFVVRHDGNLTAGTAHSGRGALIVTGSFNVGTFSFFNWDGIILAGSSPSSMGSSLSLTAIDGALVTGLDGAAQSSLTIGSGFAYTVALRRQSCHVALANQALAYLELIDGTRWEF